MKNKTPKKKKNIPDEIQDVILQLQLHIKLSQNDFKTQEEALKHYFTKLEMLKDQINDTTTKTTNKKT